MKIRWKPVENFETFCSICNVTTLSLIFLLYGAAHAEMYKYTDETGVDCITNNYDSIPKQFRSFVKVIKEEIPLSQQKLLPEVARSPKKTLQFTTTDQLQSLKQKGAPDIATTAKGKYINAVLVFAGLVAGYFILTRLTGYLGVPRVGMIAFFVFTLTGGVYLYNLYITEMSAAFSALRKIALGMKKNVETRENKTEQTMKKQSEAE